MLRPGLFALILMILGLAGLAASVGGQWERFSRYWYTPIFLPAPGNDQPDEVRRAVYADGQVWALADREIWAIAPAEHTAVRTGVLAYDVCVHDGELTIAAADLRRPEHWLIKKRRAGAWVSVADVAGGGSGLVALDCGAELRILTTDRLLTVGQRSVAAVKLSNRIPALPRNALTSTPQRLLIGMDGGEWGGALMLIDRQTGRVATLDENALRPINAVSPHPSRPDCDLVSGGDEGAANGALFEVCGTNVRTITSYKAFYGLGKSGDRVIATAVDGSYRILRDGTLLETEKPSFAQMGPFQVSVASDYFLLRAAVDERFHPGGSDAIVVEAPRGSERLVARKSTRTELSPAV